MKNSTLWPVSMVLTALILVFGLFLFTRTTPTAHLSHVPSDTASSVLFTQNSSGGYEPVNFTKVAAAVTPAVVHISSTLGKEAGADQEGDRSQDQLPDPFREFFRQFERGDNQPMPPRVGSGSGVIIDPNGYIVTNNHVVAGADKVEVSLNDNRSYIARVVGTDPSTDLAVIKIDDKALLPALPFAKSDDVQVGEWVLAVGNPFNLNSTVTAGIVSALGRNINILHDNYAVESFIQTDAAINPGNSGGALVGLNGGLLGINTAIASPTGSYSGYGFAVPSNLVEKVVRDLIEFGEVQRGVLGIRIINVNSQLADTENLNVNRGVFVDSVFAKSAAEKAGIQHGDVIVGIDGQTINTVAQLQERVARFRPTDTADFELLRDGKKQSVSVTLQATSDTPMPVAQTTDQRQLHEELGAELSPISRALARKLEVPGGLQITKLNSSGKLSQVEGLRKGFIITKIDGKTVGDADDIRRLLTRKSGGVLLEGFYEGDSKPRFYALDLG